MIIDENGAELLQIPGEMIFKGQNQKIQCTGFYVADEEIKKIADNSKNIEDISVHNFGEQAKAMFRNKQNSENIGYDANIMEYIIKNEINDFEFDGDDADDADELLPQAIEYACELGQISTSMIQRRFKLGYSRAAKIIDQIEARGLISEANGSKPREVLITKDNLKSNPFNEYQKNKENSAEQDDEENVALLRPFPNIESCDESVEIKDNLIYVKKVTKRQGPYIHTAEYTFDNRRLCGIIYTKPKIFSKGSFTFILKPNSWNVTDQRIDKTYESDLPKTELSLVVTKNNTVLFENLAKQLAKDCSIEVIYE